MGFVVEELSAGKRLVVLNIEGASIEAVERRMVDETRKKLRLPGFRAGKVPASLIRQRAGASLREDAARECVQVTAREALASVTNLLHVGDVEIKTALTDDGGLVAQLEVELKPELVAVDYRDLAAELTQRDVTDTDVDDALESLRKDMSTLVPVEDRKDVRVGDIAFVTISAPNAVAQGKVQAGDRRIELGAGQLGKEFDEGLAGAIVGEAKNVSWPVKGEDDSIEEAIVTVVVNELKIRELPALDDALALDTGKADTLAALREVLAKELKDGREREDKEKVEAQLLASLRKNNPMEIPEAYVKARAGSALRLQLEQMLHQSIDEGMMKRIVDSMKDSELDEYRHNYHEECILDAIALQENVESTEEEILEEAKRWFGNVGEASVRSWLKDEQAKGFVRGQVLRNKALDVVRAAARISVNQA